MVAIDCFFVGEFAKTCLMGTFELNRFQQGEFLSIETFPQLLVSTWRLEEPLFMLVTPFLDAGLAVGLLTVDLVALDSLHTDFKAETAQERSNQGVVLLVSYDLFEEETVLVVEV